MSTSSIQSYKMVDSVTKRHLILLLYHVMQQISLEKEKPLPYYGKMHKAAKALQDFLEIDYKRTLGYEFKDGGVSSIYDIWDNGFQEDIERYDALGKIVDNRDVPIEKDYYSHELKVRQPKGAFLLETNAKENLQRQFGDIDKLIAKIKSKCLEI